MLKTMKGAMIHEIDTHLRRIIARHLNGTRDMNVREIRTRNLLIRVNIRRDGLITGRDDDPVRF